MPSPYLLREAEGREWEVGHGGVARAPWKQGAAETHRGLELGAGSAGRAGTAGSRLERPSW